MTRAAALSIGRIATAAALGLVFGWAIGSGIELACRAANLTPPSEAMP